MTNAGSEESLEALEQSIINQLNIKLRNIDPSISLPEQLIEPLLKLIQSILIRKPNAPSIRSSLLTLINSLNRRDVKLTPQLAIQLILNYTQLNKSIIEDILDQNLSGVSDLKYQLTPSVEELVRRLLSQFNHDSQLLASNLRLISQSHPKILEIFYEPRPKQSNHQRVNTIFQSIISLLENDQNLNQIEIRRELIFIVLRVLKDGIIPRLKQATVAFDSTETVEQLLVVLHSKSKKLLNDLYLNYPNLIDHVKDLISPNTGSRLSLKSKNRLDSVFKNQSNHLIFEIFDQKHQQISKSQDGDGDHRFDSIIQSVSSVLPDLDSNFLKFLIRTHPEFQDPETGPQELIQRSFNESDFIDSNLAKFSDHGHQTSHDHYLPQSEILDVIQSRKNIFDDHLIDVTLLRKGKTRLDENEILNDKSHITNDFKMKIKSRLENLEQMEFETEEKNELILYSDDDNDSIKRLGKDRVITQADIFSDDDERFFSRKTGFDKSEEDRSDSELSQSESESEPLNGDNFKNRSTPSKNSAYQTSRTSKGKLHQKQEGITSVGDWSIDEEVLCTYYISNPHVFSPKARSSKLRIELKSKLNFTQQDDLIESWKIMFDRNRKKDKILEKYSLFKNSNQQLGSVDQNNGEATGQRDSKRASNDKRGDSGKSRGDSGQSRGGRSGARGGRGGGRGAGGRGNGSSKPSVQSHSNKNQLSHHESGNNGSSTVQHQSTRQEPSLDSQPKPGTGEARGARGSGRGHQSDHRKKINDRRVRGRDKKFAHLTTPNI